MVRKLRDGSRDVAKSRTFGRQRLWKMSVQQPFESKAKLMFCIIERKMVSKGISLAAKRDVWTALLFKEAHDTDRAPCPRRLLRPLLASPLPSLALRHRFPAVARRRTRRRWRHVPAH